MKVSFLIGGTQKGGTTALDGYLREHPEVCMADAKEAHFFDNEAAFANGTPDYGAYHSLFAPSMGHRVTGEATPIYMYWKPAAARIAEYNPDMKLIVLLRNPIERAYSHWNMEHSRNADPVPFTEAVQTETERCREAAPYQHRVFSYADRGFYTGQLRRLRQHFPEDQLLVLKSEELRAEPGRALERVARFLDIMPFPDAESREVHAGRYAAPMPVQARNYLASLFEDEIRELESMLEWDCSDWLAA